MARQHQDRVAAMDRIVALLEAGVATAAAIAAREQVSERTVYRYIDSLRAAGVPIQGEAGIGYMLRERRDDTRGHA